jgi:hypothetical protein
MKKIAGVRPLIRHDKLEVNPKELPAEQVVIFGLDDFTKPDRQSIQSIEGSIASMARLVAELLRYGEALSAY